MEGTTFCISDRLGNLGAHRTSGLFVRDTRMLRTWQLDVAGRRVDPLVVHQDAPYSGSFLLLLPATEDAGSTDVLLVRDRFVGEGMREDLTLRNAGAHPAHVVLEMVVDTDFADLFEVKDGSPPRHEKVRTTRDPGLRMSAVREGGEYAVDVVATDGEDGVGPLLRWEVTVPPHGTWTTSVQVVVDVRGDRLEPHHRPDVPVHTAEPARRHESFRAGAPRLTTADGTLTDVLARSLDDLAMLRIHDPERPDLPVVAAGAPWFMALFGRDALLTSLMLLPIDTSLAHGTLSSLAGRLGGSSDDATEEEPGRVPHELRFGPAGTRATGGRHAYYGSVDATALFVMTVGALNRWDPALVGPDLVEAADRGLGWMTGPGDADGDGFIEYERKTEHGLLHQGWKDSWDGVNSADGSLAQPPVALAEVQGYAYAAFLARADLADAAGDEDTSRRWRGRAADLKIRFNETFWLPERGWFAIGLDRDKAPIDALGSNMGHCLWTGVVADEHAPAVAAHLTSSAMWTGWGVRTLAEGMGAYNPMSYHNGSVWPHDTAICAAGLRRYGFTGEAQVLALGLVDAAQHFGGRLPELFGGFSRDVAPVPVPYPAACSPQAWAAAAPFLLLGSLLGLDAGPDGLTCAPDLPSRFLPLRLDGVRCRGRRFGVVVDDQHWTVTERPENEMEETDMDSTTRGTDGQLHASVGDRLVVRSFHGPPRDAEILEVKGHDGAPPYVVRWSDTGHEAFVYPGADASVQHFAHGGDER